MVITEPEIHDGYIEQLLHFTSEAGPIMKLRAVLTSTGQYTPIVRDYSTGVSHAAGDIRYVNPNDCLRAAKNIALNFITETAEKVVPF